MSAKRKAGGNGNGPSKRRPKKKESDYEDDVSEDSGDEAKASTNQVEVLIQHDELDPPSKLPEDLLATMDKAPGQLLIAGMVTWDLTGKRDRKNVVKVRPNLFNFHRFTDEMYRHCASGPTSAHTILINMDRKAIAFGRNPCGQLGLPDMKLCEKPTLIPGLQKVNVVQAACGRHHTLFLTDTGSVYACGDNKSGQCGVGNTQPTINVPTLINYRGSPIIRVGCGAEFSVILDIKGNLHTFGLPEYGQLGHNTDAKYFVNANKLSFHFETSPKKVVLYIQKTKEGHVTPVDNVQIVDFACGNNHTVAIDSKKRVYSWGFGGFGRLGHAEPKDEMVPRLIKFFDIHGRGARNVYCGSTFSLIVNEFGILFLFGQNKKTGEANMYPKPVQDLSGWNITDIGCANTSIMISADDTLIAWGASPTYGELGIGEFQKSSTVPKEVPKMDNMKIPQVSMGYSHTVLLVNTEHEATKLKYEKMPEYTIDD
ncbi:protein RCC2 homolog [Teleopsis dalmanni]|uniref:protein RCC2 homolog n=1 Tax=Teleopsis dalmanni TaxID=139649 RepID=UPI000D32AFA3|nr:protein RCC2 homolog [Teleopsis dalmanni]XP_037959901.1 protein RCC2 homolog [Teleopsis dalmanni]